MDTKTKKRMGGPRPGSGRPLKVNKPDWGQITCILKKDTIEALKAGAASKHFGEYLQAHLDRYPPPSREIYLALMKHEPVVMRVRGRKAPVLISSGSYGSVRIPRKPRAKRRPLSAKEYEEAIVAAG